MVAKLSHNFKDIRGMYPVFDFTTVSLDGKNIDIGRVLCNCTQFRLTANISQQSHTFINMI